MSDYVEREKVIEAVSCLFDCFDFYAHESYCDVVIEAIKEIPAADVLDKKNITHGYWLMYPGKDYEPRYFCSECQKESYFSDFCTHCNALMDKHYFVIPPGSPKYKELSGDRSIEVEVE